MVYSSKKETVPEHKDYLIYEAIKFEQHAENLRRSPGPGEKIGEAYEKAGDLRKKAGDFSGAHNDYRDAKIYGFSHNEKKVEAIDQKISNLLLERKGKHLEKQLFSILSITMLLSSLFFVSSSLTGFAISNISENNSKWIGLCFFVCGVVFAFLFLRKKYSSKHL